MASDVASVCLLTHWGRVTHICVSKLTIIGSDNGLAPVRRQAIIWTNAGILLIGPLGTNFSEILIEIHAFSFRKIHLKMSSGKWRPFYLGLNVLNKVLLTYLSWRHHAISCAGNGQLFTYYHRQKVIKTQCMWSMWSPGPAWGTGFLGKNITYDEYRCL